MKTTANIFILTLLMIFQSSIINAEQRIYTTNNDISEYPIVKTYYYAFDEGNDLILNIDKTDIAITDNGLNVNIIDSDNPDDSGKDALSLVLAFDLGVKDSEEDDSNFKLAQKVAEEIVEQFPFGPSECALTGFDQFSYLFNEFSDDPQEFAALIAGFQFGGNSNYTTGLASVPIGAIRIAQHGIHPRAVAVITDGKALADVATIVEFAKSSDVEIYFFVVGSEIPENINTICEETGGMSFDNINSEEDIALNVRAFMAAAYDYSPAYVEWSVPRSCEIDHAFTIQIPKYDAEGYSEYIMSESFIPRLETYPTYLEFSSVLPGDSRQLKLKYFARNADITIAGFNNLNSLFQIAEGQIEGNPVILAQDDSLEITVVFTPVDSSLVFDSLVVISDACSGRKIFMTGGFPNTPPKERNLNIDEPLCDKTLVIGDTVIIRWSGLLPTDIIQLEFSIDNDQPWDVLAKNVTGLEYRWVVPDIPTDNLRIRALQLWPNNVGRTMDLRHNDAVTSANFNWNGSLVITTAKDEKVGIWNSNNGTNIFMLEGHTEDVLWADFSPDETHAASASEDSTIIIWDIKTGEKTAVLRNHHNTVLSVNYHPSGKYLVSSARFGKVIIWDTDTYKPVQEIDMGYAHVKFAEFTNDGKYLVTCNSDAVIYVWDWEKKEILKTLNNYSIDDKRGGWINHFSFSQDGSKLVTADWFNKVVVWDMTKEQEVQFHEDAALIIEDDKPLSSASFDHSGQIILTCATDNNAKLWNANTGELLKTMIEHRAAVQTAFFNFDDSRVLTSSWDSTAKIWNLEKRDLQADTADCLFRADNADIIAFDIDMGKVGIGQSSNKISEDFIENLSDFTYNIYDVKISGDDAAFFTILTNISDEFPYEIEAGQKKSIEIRYSPLVQGTDHAQIEIYYSGGKLVKDLVGEGYNSGLYAESDYIDFAAVEIGDFADTVVSVVVRNRSTDDINITDIQLLGPHDEHFSILKGGDPVKLAAGAGHQMEFRFIPPNVSLRNAQIVFRHDGIGSKCAVLLFGEGVKPLIDTATIYFDDFYGTPGEVVNLPIRIKNVGETGLRKSTGGLIAEMEFNSTLLDPTGFDYESEIIGGKRKIKFIIPTVFAADSVLTSVSFRVGLGNDSLSNVSLKTAPVNKSKAVLTDEGAQFTLTGICENGGTRLFNSDGEIRLSENKPNPFTDHTVIEYEIIEDGMTKLYICDLSGKIVKPVVAGYMTKDRYSTEITATGLPSGTYYLILETPTVRTSRRMQIKK